MALTPKRITLLTTAAPVVIEMVRKYWPLIEQKLRENPELLSSVQAQLRRLAELRKAGNSPLGAERAVAAWTLHLRGLGAPFNDARADKIADLGSGSLEDSVSKVCGFLEIDDRDSKASILALARQLQG